MNNQETKREVYTHKYTFPNGLSFTFESYHKDMVLAMMHFNKSINAFANAPIVGALSVFSSSNPEWGIISQNYE